MGCWMLIVNSLRNHSFKFDLLNLDYMNVHVLVAPFATNFPKMSVFYFIGLILDEFLLKLFRCHIISPVKSMGF